MKRVSLVIALLLALAFGIAELGAQPPRSFSFQGVLTTPTLSPLPDGPYRLTIRLYIQRDAATEVWSEDHVAQTRAGVFTIDVGSIRRLPNFQSNEYWVGISVDSGSELIPRTQLLSVPYALRSEFADTALHSRRSDGLSDGASGAVLALNGLQGRVDLEGRGGIRISTNGNVVIATLDTAFIANVISSDTTLDVVRTSNNIDVRLRRSGVASGTYGSASTVPVVSVDAFGRVTRIDTVRSEQIGLPGGDLTGKYPDPVVRGLQGRPLSPSAPTAGQVLKWDGSQWIAGTDDSAAPVLYTAGTGIRINGTVIENIGDLDTTNDLTKGSSAGGDLSGVFPIPTVSKIQGRDVSPILPTLGQVLKWNGTAWIPQDDNDNNTAYTAGAGVSITGTTIANTGDTDAANDITTTTAAGGDLLGTYPNPSVVKLHGRDIAANAPAVGQVLKWNGTAWIPQDDNDNNTAYTAGAGVSITGTTIANTGDTDAANDITNTTAAGGDLGGTYPNPAVNKIRGRDVSATAPAVGQVLKWDGTAWLPQADNDDNTTYTAGVGVSITGTTIANTGDTDAANDITNTTGAGGDLGGTYPNPTVNKIRGRDVSATAPAVGQVLKWDGTAWLPQADNDDNTTYTAGVGVSITGTTIANTGDNDAANDITNTTAAGGDLGGTYPNPTVNKIRGRDVSATAPAVGQVLKWDGTAWLPQADNDNNTTYTAGVGVSITGTTIANTGDTDAANDITNTTGAGGDLGGTYPNPTVNKIRGRDVSATAPAVGQVLKWDGTAWLPQADNDNNTTYTAGTGVSITGTTIANTGDTDAANDITNTTGAGGDLGGTYPNPTVNKIRGRDVSATAPAVGQVLKWDGTAWLPQADNDNNTTYTAGVGVSITGTTIANTGDTDAANDITNTTGAGGDLGGTYPNPTVNKIRGRDVSATAPAVGQVLKWDGTAWLPQADNDNNTTYTAGVGVSITGTTIANTGDTDAANDITNTTGAGGDLGGTYPNPTVNKIRGRDVQDVAPANGNVLKWSVANNRWEPQADDGQTYTAGAGVSITGTTITNTGDTDAANDITNTTGAGGDLGGTYPNPTVTKIRGRDVSATAPAVGQVLKWDGTAWLPQADNDNNTTYTAGVGVSITGTTIANTGDTDAANDITNTTGAGGDLGGTYPNPTVNKIRGRDVQDVAPANGNVLKWSVANNRWEPQVDDGQTYTAGAGVSITGTTIANTGDTDAANDITNTTGAGGDLGGTYPNPTVNKIRGRDVQDVAPANGNVLKWSVANNRWEPQADDGQTYTAGTGVSITGTTIANTGDTDAANDITNTTGAGGDLGGTYPNPTVNKIRGRDVSATAPAVGQVLKWDGTAWLPQADNDNNTTYTAGVGVSITGTTIANTGDTDAANDITNTTGAGGDLGGTYPNPTVNKIRGRDVSATAPAVGQVLKWDGTAWLPQADNDNNTTYTAGTGVSITGTTIANTGDTDAANDITNTTGAGGDLGGTYPNPTVNKIRGRDVQDVAPANGNVLKWSVANNRWEPQADDGQTYTAGAGVSITGTTIANTGDVDPANDITNTTGAGGDLGGTYPNPTVNKIRGRDVQDVAPANGNVLKWSVANNRWEPQADANTVLTAGPGISIQLGIISNSGDRDSTNDITTSTNAGGDLSGLYPSPKVEKIQGRPVKDTLPEVGQTLTWVEKGGVGQWTPSTAAKSWLIGGNSQVNFPNPDGWLGTLDATQLDFRVNNVHQLRLNVNGSIQRANDANTRGVDAFDMQRTDNATTNSEHALGKWSTILNGYRNQISSAAQSAAVLGGTHNEVHSSNSVVLGGTGNVIQATQSVAFGNSNYVETGDSYSMLFGSECRTQGSYAFAFGVEANAGLFGVAFGSQSEAPGDFAFAQGELAIASGSFSHASGDVTTASGTGSFVHGQISFVSGLHGVAFGVNDTVNASYGMAVGEIARSKGAHALAFGYEVEATGGHSLSFGDSVKTTGLHSLALGRRIQSTADYSVGIGRGSDLASGTLINSVANSLMIGFNSDVPTLHVTGGTGALGSTGNVGIGVTNPTRKLDVNGTARIGTNGTTLNAIIRATVNLNMGNVPAGDQNIEVFNVANAALGGTVVISPGAALPANLIVAQAWVSDPGEVSVRFVNVGAAGANPAAMDYYITVIQ